MKSKFGGSSYEGTDTGKTIFDGKYKVFVLPESSRAAYRIESPRGEWILLRNQHQPHMMFPMNATPTVTKIRGYTWFMDHGDGNIEPKF